MAIAWFIIYSGSMGTGNPWSLDTMKLRQDRNVFMFSTIRLTLTDKGPEWLIDILG